MSFSLTPERAYDSLFVLVLALFIGFKVSHTGLPFYWDEAWSYAPAVYAMYDEGPTLLPGKIAPELTRGHPLLFYFLGSSWLTFIHPSSTSLHFFALIVSLLLLFSTYYVGSRLTSRSIGLFAVCFIVVNELFLAQSGLFLPEVLLSTFTTLLVYAYIRKRKDLVILFGTLALLTKESAIVITTTLIVWQLVRLIILRSDTRKDTLIWLGVLFIPYGLCAIHFAYQYHLYGWLLFPEHISMLSLELKDVIYKMKLSHLELFERQGFEWLLYSFALISTFFYFRSRSKRWKAVVIPLLYIASIKVLFGRWTLPVGPTLLVPMACLAVIGYMKYLSLYKSDQTKGEFIAISYLFIIGYILFTSMNFYTDRYLMSLMPLASLGMTIFIAWTFESYYKHIAPTLLTILLAVQLLMIGKDEKIGDTRLSYIDDIKVHQQVISICEELHLHDESISMSFMEQFYCENKIAGYLSGRPFTNISQNVDDSTNYVILTNASPGPWLELRNDPNWIALKKIKHGIVWGEVRKKF